MKTLSMQTSDEICKEYIVANARREKRAEIREQQKQAEELDELNKLKAEELAKFNEYCWQGSGRPQLKACVLNAIKGGLTEERFIEIARWLYCKHGQGVGHVAS